MDFVKNVSMMFSTNVLLFFIGIPTAIIIARILGPTGRGIYALVFLIPALLLLVGDFGIGMANTYFVGKNKFKLSDVASNSLVFGFANGVFLIALFSLFYIFFLDIFFKDVPTLFIYLVIITLPFSLIAKYFTGILLAKFKIKEFNLIMLFTSLFNLIGVIFLLIFFNKGIFSLILLSILISISTCPIYLFLVGKLTNYKLSFKVDVFKKEINFGVKAYFANIFSFLNYRLDMLLVNFFVGVTQVGYYSIAVGIAELVWFIPRSIQIILFPEVASSNDSDSRRAEEMTAVLCRNTVFITSALCVGLAIIGRELIEIMFGSVYLPSFMPLFVLLPGVVMGSIGNIIAAYLSGKGKPIFAMYASSTSLIVNIILNLLLIPLWGIAGAAFATTITYTLEALIMFVPYLKMSQNGLTNSLIIKPKDFRLYSNLITKALLRKGR